MDEVWVMAGIHAAGLEPDLALLFVYLVDGADYPGAFGDLILDGSGDSIEKVEMIPSVALRHPDDLATVIQVGTVFFARITEEGLRLFADDSPRLGCDRVHLDHAIDL